MSELEQEQQQQGQNGDRSVEDLADEPQAEEPTPPMQIPLEGFGDTITATPGGDRPKSASVALRGGKLNVEGEFKKGDVIELFVSARVAEVHFVDTVDQFGQVVGTERRHVAKPIAVRRLSATED